MHEAVLCVDDDPRALVACRRFLESDYEVETAPHGKTALAIMAERPPFAVVVSDLQMPEMNGIAFLSAARARHPDTVRLLLTGHADVQSAIAALNDGQVFRFLTKPCSPTTLLGSVRAGVEQYHLITAQRDLLENTLRACVRVLGEVLAMVSPVAFGRALRVRQLVRSMVRTADLVDDWALDVAAMLCQLGCVAIPESVLLKATRDEALDVRERTALVRYPTVGADLLRSIPRLERVAAIVAHQNYHYPALARLIGTPEMAEVALGAGLLKAALDFDALTSGAGRKVAALETMRAREGWYDPVAMAALETLVRTEVPFGVREIRVEQLAVGMVLARDVRGSTGPLLLERGAPVTEAIKLRLQSLAAHGAFDGSLTILAPDAQETH